MALVKIQEITTDSGGLASITFSSITQNFTHLRLLGILRTNRTVTVGDDIILRFNGDTGANYYYATNPGSLTAGASGATSYARFTRAASSANTANFFGNIDCYITNYTNTILKGVFCNNGAMDGVTQNIQPSMGSWNNSAAITSISLTPTVGTLFTQYSQITLYGIR